MASIKDVRGSAQQPQLEPDEIALLDLAADDGRRDMLSLSDKEALILRLYDQIQELDLEKALLEQELEEPSGDNIDEQLAVAERELLEARATYTVRRKAVESVLMTDPSLKAIHLKAASPAERALVPLINRRDLLSLIQENLATAHAATLEALSNAEVENMRVNKKNQELARTLLDLTSHDSRWKERIEDEGLKAQLEELEAEHKKRRARWETIKSIASAAVVGSGVDWARDDRLRELVLDESDY
ncbi:centromere protein H (CENP-H)-domain-containing protein [Thermoascus aurantiacus ATCC 26904]